MQLDPVYESKLYLSHYSKISEWYWNCGLHGEQLQLHCRDQRGQIQRNPGQYSHRHDQCRQFNHCDRRLSDQLCSSESHYNNRMCTGIYTTNVHTRVTRASTENGR
uniref:Uncharacterized protein n=1 Tax=Cacopsylla melanoneura TaxID=428564 RepID=A0A8D8ZVH3_9HEMI